MIEHYKRHTPLFWGFFQPMEKKYIDFICEELRLNAVHVSKRGQPNVFELVARSAEFENNHMLPLGWEEEFIEKHFREFLFNYDRYSLSFEKNVISAFEGDSNYDYLCAINYYLSYFYNLIISKGITQVVFNNPPHQGIDLIIYYLASKLGLDKNILYQTILPNRFFHYKNIDDFGRYSKFVTFNPSEGFSFEKRFEKELFYMEGRVGHNHMTRIFNKTSLSLRKTKKILRKLSSKEDMKKLIAHRKKKFYGAKAFTNESKFYRSKGESFESLNINLEEKFVYFPLHYQPELTTSCLGGLYTDQLLAIENLARILPEGWFIYVKENPKQGHYMRGRAFYERLSKIESAILVSKSVSTYELLKQSQVVATISGTVGWEALSGGKPIITFGMAWYRDFSGVHCFSHNLNLKDISNQNVDHTKLQSQVNEFSKSCNQGIVASAYRKLYKNYETTKNNVLLLNFFDQLTKLYENNN
ncbi:hypothetical protein [Salinivibrio kushneri]|uniref:Capsule biosynthesis protein n=1 Tax=Salinivibrio kushneri TaxID=1908198 RepID=A0AA47KJ06_9GAMM|nr:hypothetical protein [Salinivibrio kushneri]WBA07881.1 hypothetical protein N8M53_08500 [Salinivibrio kushneri]